MVEVGTKLSAWALQICCDNVGAGFVITGTGFTVAFTTKVGPGHPLEEGVIVYTTVPFMEPCVFTSSWEIVLPDPAEAPLTLVATAVQLYVVPVTPFGFVMAIDVDSLEQIVWLVADALVTGRTVTTKFTGEPLHPPIVGVMV